MKTILQIESSEVLHVPWVGYALAVTPLQAICRRVDDFYDDEGSFPRGGQLVHVVGLLYAP
jgi:hypothetical protein